MSLLKHHTKKIIYFIMRTSIKTELFIAIFFFFMGIIKESSCLIQCILFSSFAFSTQFLYYFQAITLHKQVYLILYSPKESRAFKQDILLENLLVSMVIFFISLIFSIFFNTWYALIYQLITQLSILSTIYSFKLPIKDYVSFNLSFVKAFKIVFCSIILTLIFSILFSCFIV